MERIQFVSGEYELEGIVTGSSRKQGVVVTHPHPLYGGDMYNPVVESIAREYAGKGYKTLCFNFRGTGRSQGLYDDGRGEQTDVAAAVAWMRETGVAQIALAGYSFGAWVNAQAFGQCGTVAHMVMVAPPVGFLDFSQVRSLPCLELVIVGDHDAFAPVADVRLWVDQAAAEADLEIVGGADHFFSGQLSSLGTVLRAHL